VDGDFTPAESDSLDSVAADKSPSAEEASRAAAEFLLDVVDLVSIVVRN
jgi:hypothetical protein